MKHILEAYQDKRKKSECIKKLSANAKQTEQRNYR